MFLASAAILAAVLVPAQAEDTDEREVFIPGTTINVCVIADVEVLDEITADLEAQVQVIVDDVTDQELLDLKAQCAQQVVIVPPGKVTPPPAGGNGGGSQTPRTPQVVQVPQGAPETGDGSTESPWSLVGFGAVALGGAAWAFGTRGRGQAPARR